MFVALLSHTNTSKEMCVLQLTTMKKYIQNKSHEQCLHSEQEQVKLMRA